MDRAVDVNELRALFEESRRIHRSDPQGADSLLDKMLQLTDREETAEWYCRALLAKAELQRVLHSDVSREHMLNEALTLAEAKDLDEVRGSAHNALGMLAYENNNLTIAQVHLGEAVEIAQQLQHPQQLAIAANSLGVLYANSGDFQAAIRHFFDSLEAFRQLNDDRGIGTAYSNIGALYLEIGEHDTSVKYAERGLRHRLLAGDRYGACLTSINLSVCLITRDKLNAAVDILLDAETYAKQTLPTSLAKIYALLAHVYALDGERQQALKYLRQSEQMTVQYEDRNQLFSVNYYLASAYMSLNNCEQACSILKSTLSLVSVNTPPADIGPVHFLLSTALERAEKHSEARHQRRIAERLREEQRSMQVVREVYGISARRELLAAEQKRSTQRVNGRRQTETVKQRLDETLYSHVRSSQVLNSIRGEIAKLLPGLEAPVRTIADSTLSRIDTALDTLKHSPLPEGYLESQHVRFLQKLREDSPGLTPAELRICILLVHKFRSKEIAEMLACTSGTVNIHRKNIRKKLSLAPGRNLTTYLLAL